MFLLKLLIVIVLAVIFIASLFSSICFYLLHKDFMRKNRMD